MIGRLRGNLIDKLPPEALIEVAGVGYEVQVPMTSFYALPEKGQEVTLHTHFVVREDAQLLFGFVEKSERDLFRLLIKANGVGPKLALTILSGMSGSQFVQCVNNDDVSTLVKLPGVGKKTAERLLVEMRDRLKKWQADLFTPATDMAPMDNQGENAIVSVANDYDDAISALEALGYTSSQATKTVKKVAKPGMRSEELIKASLKSML